ncbi:hypothetical protein KM176_06120 [Pseudooceanicola sp. CBS1P-1]|uniref:Response regulatory domain-containing protein n=1 Tax=Pseudooceanicola albus TaxID=2692189 RepID=A0A6L7FY82_9RHOB|nr:MULTISPECIES: hypothetical protein [Pseudooceanicola]MBT9383428.1 hypothetical protein [Pseudooceanicola endophyticus]MXN16250.1 hypothetical protein [Pseudooceanicola albus]
MTACSLLIIDDDAELSDITAKACCRLGYPALTASGAEAALAALAVEPGIALALIDIRPGPGDTGFALAARLRQRRPALTLRFVSGLGQAASRPADFADARILRKPLSLDALRDVLEEALGPVH